MMKEKTTIPKRVKGTVLFTVVAVMMVLIVFLTATLALATTASNRAYSNYQKAQTQATARAVLDTAIKAVNEKEDFRKAIAKDGTKKIEVQLDGAAYTISIDDRGKQQMFDTENQKWVEGNVYEFSTTVAKNMADTTYSVYALANGDSGINGPPPSGGAFVALGNLGVDNIGTQGYVMGGTEIGVGNTELKDFWTENQAKIQAPFYVNGNLGIGTSNVFEFTSIGDFFVVTGDLGNKNIPWFKSTPELRNAWNSSLTVDYNKVPYVYVGGQLYNDGNNRWNFILSANPEGGDYPTDFNTDSNPHPMNNNDLVALNMYVNDLHITSGIAVYGDIYAFGETSENLIEDYGYKSVLYEWTERTIKNSDDTTTQKFWGNYYSQNNTTMNGQNNKITVQGECRVAGTLTVKGSKGLEVAGDVVCDKLIVEAGSTLSCANLYANNISVNGHIDTTTAYANEIMGGGSITGTVFAGSVPPGTSTTTTISYVTTSELVEALPKANPWDSTNYRYTWTGTKTTTVNGVVTEEIVRDASNPLVITENNGYWMDQESTLNQNPEYQKIKAGSSTQTITFPAYGGAVTPLSGDALAGCGDIYPQDYTKDNIETKILTKPKATAYTNYPTTLDELDEKVPIYQRDASGDPIKGDLSHLPTYTSGTITTTCILPGGSYDKIYVDPASSDPIVIIVTGKAWFSDPGGFVVNDNKGTVYFYLDDDAELHLGKTGIITTDYYKILTGTEWDVSKLGTDLSSITKNMVDNIKVNQVCKPDSDYYPNVVIHAGQKTYKGDGTIDHQPGIYIANSDNPITANVRAPYLHYEQNASNANTGSHHATYVQKDDITGATIESDTIYLHLIGQLIADEIKLPNQWGMLYVTTGDDADEEEEEEEEEEEAGGVPKRFAPIYYNIY